MNLRSKVLFSIGLPALLCLMLPGSLRAQTTFTYTGNPYPGPNSYGCAGNYVCNGTTPFLTITFTTTLSLSQLSGTSIIIPSSSITSFTISDNYKVTITQASNSVSFYAQVTTNPSGIPTDWDVWAQATGSPSFGYEGLCSLTRAYAANFGNPNNTGCFFGGNSGDGDSSILTNVPNSLSYYYGTGSIAYGYPYNGVPGVWTATTTPITGGPINEAITVADTPIVAVTPPLVTNAAPLAYFSAGSLGFGGQTGAQPLAVSNLGQANLSLAVSPPASPFSISQVVCTNGVSSLPTTLPPGGACYLSIAYIESASGSLTGAITFTDNAGLSNLTSTGAGSNFMQSVPLSAAGAGVGPPSLPPTTVFVSVNEPVTAIDAETISVPIVTTPVTLATIPSGLLVAVDNGTPQTAPAVFTLAAGPHTISVATTQAGSTGTQYVFLNWSDSGAATHPVVIGSSPATFTAVFQRQYQLTTAASPAVGGAVVPAGGTFQNAGAVVSVLATVHPGYQFANFSGALSGSTNPQNVTMNGPVNVVANFTPLTPNLAASVGARTPTGSFVMVSLTLTNTGLGAATNATISSITAITDVAGTGTVTASPSPVNLGAINPGASATGTVTFVWPSTATRVSFTVNFTADGGYAGSSKITTLY